MGDRGVRDLLGGLQMTTTEGETDAPEIFKLAQSLYSLHSRFGEPDTVSFLDWGVRFSWCLTSARMDRYEEVPMDPKLLHFLSWSTGDSCEVHLHIDGDEFVITGPGYQIRTRINDLAETSAFSRRCSRT